MAYSIHSKMRLQDKVESCWHRISNHRAARERIFKSYLGDTHGLSDVNSSRIPLNGHALYARALIQYLAANQPKLRITTDVGPWKPHMESTAFQASRVMRAEKFGFKQQRWVLDALMYSPGILKICQEWVRVPQGNEGDYAEALKTIVANVDFSDWGYDTAASSVYDADFTFIKVRKPVDDIIGNPMFAGVDEDVLRGMSGSGMAGGNSERLFFEDDDESQPYRDQITLYECYDRCEQRIKIWPADATNIELYNEVWDGHENGPYHYIDYLDVPNHVVGLSPMCLVHDLIEATNRALSKSIAQTDVAKNILRVTGGNRAEAEALMEARDGQAVYMDGGGVSEIMNIPGPDNRTLAMVPILKDLFNWQGGNINELAGLGVSAPTATQGKLLSDAASGMVNFMQARTQEAVRLACEAIVHNELKDDVTTEMIPEMMADGQTYWKRFTPEDRQKIEGILINVNIDVNSMRYRSPDQKLQSFMQWWNGFALPSYQITQAQGGDLDIQACNRIYADLSDMSEINDVYLYSMRPQTEGMGVGGPQPIKQSPVTSRTNIRADRGGGSPDMDLAASLVSDAA